MQLPKPESTWRAEEEIDMGLSLFSKCSASCCCAVCTPPKPEPKSKFPNPDPKNFRLVYVEEVGDFLIALVWYPDCTNYEGKKLLLFKGVTAKAIREAKEIDPHFCNSVRHRSPIARFEPTQEGLNLAFTLVHALPRKVKWPL